MFGDAIGTPMISSPLRKGIASSSSCHRHLPSLKAPSSPLHSINMPSLICHKRTTACMLTGRKAPIIRKSSNKLYRKRFDAIAAASGASQAAATSQLASITSLVTQVCPSQKQGYGFESFAKGGCRPFGGVKKVKSEE